MREQSLEWRPNDTTLLIAKKFSYKAKGAAVENLFFKESRDTFRRKNKS